MIKEIAEVIKLTFLALFSFSSVSKRTQARAAPTVQCSAFLSYSVYVIKYFL